MKERKMKKKRKMKGRNKAMGKTLFKNGEILANRREMLAKNWKFFLVKMEKCLSKMGISC